MVLIDGEEPLLCLTAGDRRVDVEGLGPGVRMARGRDVKELTGYAIGGVPPVGHDRPLGGFRELLQLDRSGRLDELMAA